MLHQFAPPAAPTGYDCIPLGIRFYEGRIPGTDTVFFEVMAYNIDSAIYICSAYPVDSWESMKTSQPNLHDWLDTFARDPLWNASFGNSKVIYYLAEIEGADPFYDLSETVWIKGNA